MTVSETRALDRRAAPHQGSHLWSLWDFMHRIDIEAYFLIGGLIQSGAEMARNQESTKIVTNDQEQHFIGALDVLLVQAKLHSLKRTITNATEAKGYFDLYRNYPNKPCYGDVHMMFGTMVSKAARDDLRELFVMFIEPAKAIFYDQPGNVLGDAVLSKFEVCKEDIREAGNCFAADRNTACVFHLMRVMEYGVQRFGKKLGVPLQKVSITKLHEYTWHEILELINPQLAKITQTTRAGKAKHERYSAIQVELFRVKDAWRNPTMHPRKEPYNALEALNIMNHVRSFMGRLAEIV